MFLISRLDRPHLMVVDLLGLIHAENKLQTAADVNMVQGMVRSPRPQYKDKETLVLSCFGRSRKPIKQLLRHSNEQY